MTVFQDLFDNVIKKLGGRKYVLSLLGISSSALSNYRKRGIIPSEKLRIIKESLEERDWSIDLQTLKISSISNSKTILMIITGGIASYKSLDLSRKLIQEGYNIIGLMTKNAQKFITPLSLSTLTGQKVYTDLFSLIDETEMGHIKLARNCDLILVIPCTANFIAKLAHGIADDLASTVCLTTNSPIVIAPSMNPDMYKNVATQSNLNLLKNRGYLTIGPDIGGTACNEIGKGRLSDIQTMINFINFFFEKKQIKYDSKISGKHILITSGPTHEPIDPIRFITNKSSGKQGESIAYECIHRGAKVTIVTGPVTINYPEKAKIIKVKTAKEMLEECEKQFPIDIAICVAAVSDWGVKEISDKKIKKTNRKQNLTLHQNPDILEILSKSSKRPDFVVGFAAETENLEYFSKEKLLNKKCNLIVGNLISLDNNEEVFENNKNKVCFVSKEGYESLPMMTKDNVAKKILDKIEIFFEPK